MAKAETIGEVFRRARLTQKLTQVQVANSAGLHPNSYAKIERGERSPEFVSIKRISRVLKLDINELPV